MSNILVGVTGSVAAVKIPDLVAGLTAGGHSVRLVATKTATYFFDPAPFRSIITLDEDEWPGDRYARGDAVRHVELRNWADTFLIAPLDANTLAKLAFGLCDNTLTCVWRAWDPTRPVVLAPAMNTLMWRHPLTRRHLLSLAADWGLTNPPQEWDEDRICEAINARCQRLRIARPVEKTLACGDTGVGAMAEVSALVTLTTEWERR
ncbi:MAG TPA: flavoprotein [Fimbriiglobus sp.]